MSIPAITVLLPAYNAGEYLQGAIESILRQTFADFELLIIDDGSTDRTLEIASQTADPRVRVLSNERNLGLTATLNRGLREARAELVARQDADDWSAPRRLELQVARLKAQPELLLLGCSGEQVDASGLALSPLDEPQSHLAIRWKMLWQNAFLHSGVMFRRERVLEEFGGYDESLRICQDYDLWARIIRKYPAANLPERLITLRSVKSSLMNSGMAQLADETQRIQRAYCAAELPQASLSASDAALLQRFPSGLGIADSRAFWPLMKRLLGMFLELHPDAAGDPEFWATLAALIARVGYNLLPEHRTAGARFILRAVAVRPAAAWRLPWTRIAGLMLLGDRARSLYRRVARKGAVMT